MVMSRVTVTEEQATKIRPYLNAPVPERNPERTQHYNALADILVREIPHQLTIGQALAIANGLLNITLNVVAQRPWHGQRKTLSHLFQLSNSPVLLAERVRTV